MVEMKMQATNVYRQLEVLWPNQNRSQRCSGWAPGPVTRWPVCRL